MIEHVLYASIVWLAAWLLTSMRRGSATTKYWIWVATSLNFLLPLGALPERLWPLRLGWLAPHLALPRLTLAPIVIAAWLLGSLLMLARLALRIHAELSSGAAGTRSPAVAGLLRPRIVLPEGIDRVLTGGELQAVLVHERTHARRRDNLLRLVHEACLCFLWFHPLVWMTGSRLALYRELSCDEAVARRAQIGDLVSALAKLAAPPDASLLHATASSFIHERLARLQEAEPRRLANVLLALAFGAVLFAAAVGPVARAAAHAACGRLP